MSWSFQSIGCIILFAETGLNKKIFPRGHEKIWPCKVGHDEKSLKSTDLHYSFQ